MIVSAREGPCWDSSIESPVRASDPSTRIVLPESRLPSLDSARFALSDTPSSVWALTRNSTSDRSSQPHDREHDPLDDPARGDPAALAGLARLAVTEAREPLAKGVQVASAATAGWAPGGGSGRRCTRADPGRPGWAEGRSPDPVYRPAMPPRRVIGVDAGGTKLLGGVVDEQLVVHHRVHRIWRGSDRQETLDIFVEAVEEIRAAVSGRGRGGIRPARSRASGERFECVVHAPPARGRPLPRSDERAARAARARGQRRQRRAAGRAPPRGRGRARPRGDGPARHGHRRRPPAQRTHLPRRDRRRAPSSATWSWTTTAPTARAPARAGAASR